MPSLSNWSQVSALSRGATWVGAIMAGVAALALCTPSARAQTAGSDHIPTARGAIELVPIHHASLMMSWNGEHILVDPAPTGDAGAGGDVAARYKALPQPNFILITHIHGDHFNVPIVEAIAGPNTEIIAPRNVHDAMPADLQARTKVLENGDRTTIGSVGLEAVPMYNITPGRLKYHPKGLGNGYVLTFADKRVYIAGDTEETPELAHLPDIDVAFIPMNLPYTQSVEAAARWVRDFKPRIVYPYHYRMQGGGYADLARFKSLVGNASIVRLRKWY
jgi:L-ascorbate metabolism protein UlaG (beta-lactamase superfamily)